MDPKKQLQKLIDDLKTKQFRDGEAKGLVQTIGEELKSQLGPLFTAHSKEITDSVKSAFKDLKIDVPKSEAVQLPEFPAIPPFPEQKAPVVNIPAPIVNVPAPNVTVTPTPVSFPDAMSLKAGSKPFPVIMMDQAGKPMFFPTAGSSGPGFPMQTLDNTGTSPAIRVSVSSSNNSTQTIDSSGNPIGTAANPINVAITSGASSSTKAQIGNSDGDFSAANPLNVVFSASASTGSALIDSSGVQYSGSNPFPVTITSGSSATSASNIVDSSGIAYTGSNPVPVTLISGSISSTRAQIGNSDGDFSAANPLPVSNIGLAVDNGDSASAQRVVIAGNSSASVVVNSGTITTVTSITNSIAATLTDSSGVGYSGSNPLPIVGPVVVTSITNTTAANIVDSSGVAYSGSNPLPIVGPVVVTSVTNTIAAANIDSSGVQYSGSNPFPFTLVTSATATLNAALTDSGGVQYSGSNPVPVTLITSVTQNTNLVGGGNDSIFTYMARMTNPTAVADGADVRPKADKLGRVLTRPIQVRDLTKTAYATLSTQAETTILGGTTSAFNDLIMLTATNASASAWKVDIRGSLAGNIVHTMYVPANTGPIGFAPSVPYPAADLGATWTATISSGSDVSNANLFITGLFSQEI